MKKDSLFFQFMIVIATVGTLMAGAMAYIISVPLVSTLTEIEERPLHLVSDEIFGVVSDSFHDLLDERKEDDSAEVEAAKQDVLARIRSFKPSGAPADYHFLVIDGGGRVLLDSAQLFGGSSPEGMPGQADEGRVSVTDVNGSTLVGYVRYYPAWRWQLVTLIHEDDLRQETLKIKLWILGAGVTGFLLLMALFYYVLKRRVQGPLSALVGYAKSLEEGTPAAIDEQGKGEVRELSKAFNRMSGAIRAREEKLFELAKLTESNPNLLLKVSPGGQVLYSNRSVPRKLAEMGLPADKPEILLPPNLLEVCRGLRLEEGLKKELTFRIGDRTFLYTVFGFADEDAAVFHGSDITDRKLMEEQLFHAHKMETLGRIAGGVAHDFNNLLAGILGYASLLKSQQMPDGPVPKAIESIERAAERGTQLTRQLLGFARKGTHEFLPLDINRIVDETADIVSQTFTKAISIRRDKAPGLPFVLGDGTQVHQCLMNLCINARDAMEDGGTIRICTSHVLLSEYKQEKHFRIPAGSYLSITVQDEGQGMDETTLERIFDPFFTTKDHGKGTGLGMSMVYGIVKNHGGFITIRSSLGRGTTVEILLPAAESAAAPADVRPSRSPEVPRGDAAGLVLLVDDEEFVRDVGKAMLSNLGYEVITAVNGKEGVEIFRQHRDSISMVILDLMMPVMDGRKAFEGIREIDPAARIVISTGYSGDQDVDMLKEMGASAILTKPYSYNAMTSVVSFVQNR